MNKTSKQNNNNNDINFKKLFNMNNILSQVMNFAAYIILVISACILIYCSFIDKIAINTDIRTLTIYSGAAILLTWINWNSFYKKQYEKCMADDIAQSEQNKYSIHSRYYMAIKDWDDVSLQKKIDEFNDEYTNKWLRYVEKTTGFPIETCTKVQLDIDGKPMLDPETNKPKIIEVKGIKDLPYRGFKHKMLMWRIKTHHYPKSGYTSSMELMSLFSFQDSNLNKRHLQAHKSFYVRNSISKLISSMLLISIGGSIIPEFIGGNIWSALLKLIIVIGTLISAVLMGSMQGIRGARLKLSSVEDACNDLEKWANKKPILTPYKEPIIESKDTTIQEDKETQEVTSAIFNIPKSTR